MLLGSGCDFQNAGKTKIRFWNGFTGPDGRTILRMVKAFNAENPDVHVTLQRVDWATYYNKLFVAGIGNRAPEVFIIHTDTMPRFSRANFLEPLDKVLEASGLPEKLDAKILDSVRFDDKHYALPLDIHTFGMWYNKTLLREAGIVDSEGKAKPPETREEFLDALKKLTKDEDNDGRPEQWGFVFTWFRNVVYTVMCQYGARFFTDDQERCTLNEAANVKALQYCTDLIQKYKVAPSPENFDAWIGFRQGKVGICFEGIWMLADLQKQTDLDWGAAPVPQLGPQPAVFAGGHNMCMRKGLPEKKQQAAWRFMRYLSDNSLTWAEGGQIPARRDLRQSEKFRQMKAQNAFAQQLPYAVYGPRVPFIFEFNTEFDFAVEQALRGSLSAKEALDQATQEMNETLKRQRKMMEYAHE